MVSFQSPLEARCVMIPASGLQNLLRLSSLAAPNETGGLLIGYYTTEMRVAIVTETIGPTLDSRSSPFRFDRGVKGLDGFLNRAWKESGHYYLGEWHSHPGARPYPSPIDSQQMREIGQDTRYDCPEPILLIIGNAMSCKRDCRCHLYRWNGNPIELHPNLTEEQTG